MPSLLIRIIPLAILLFFGIRYFLLSLRPNLFKIDYFKLDEQREALANKIDHLKIKARLKPKPGQESASLANKQTVREENGVVHFEYHNIKIEYEKDAGLSNIFLIVSLFPELHAHNRFAEGLAGVISLKEAKRLASQYADILSPRGLRGRINEADTEKYFLIYPPSKAAALKAELKEARRALFNLPERVHMQFKGQLLKYKAGYVNGQLIDSPIKANVLYLQYVQLIHAYNTDTPSPNDGLEMEKPLMP